MLTSDIGVDRGRPISSPRTSADHRRGRRRAHLLAAARADFEILRCEVGAVRRSPDAAEIAAEVSAAGVAELSDSRAGVLWVDANRQDRGNSIGGKGSRVPVGAARWGCDLKAMACGDVGCGRHTRGGRRRGDQSLVHYDDDSTLPDGSQRPPR